MRLDVEKVGAAQMRVAFFVIGIDTRDRNGRINLYFLGMFWILLNLT